MFLRKPEVQPRAGSPGAFALPFRIGTLGELSQVIGKVSQCFPAFTLVELCQQAQGLDNITPIRTLSLRLGLPGSATKRNQVGCPETSESQRNNEGFCGPSAPGGVRHTRAHRIAGRLSETRVLQGAV